MQPAEQRALAVQQRDDRIIEGIKQGLSVKEIAARVGVDEDYAKTLRRQLAQQHGLTIGSGSTPELPFGITERSRILRARLSLKLANLTDQRGLHPVEVAYSVGVPQKAQAENRSSPYGHDWKLSELERLAALEGKDVIQLLQEILRPKLSGEVI